ncbi:MAG TPA: histidine phosphatase family protein [Thermoleophilaceae bacterium]|nr:histidine phosphatase family protein [Thermoleophilaceae bacterium]
MSPRHGPEIVLARHGETQWSREMRHTGRTDVPLTDEGRRQAAALHDRLAGREFAKVLVSPLSRAVETCRLAGLGDRAERRPELVELEYGEAEGLTTAQLRERIPGWTVWTHRTPGAETLEQVGTRLEPLVAELRDTDDDIAIFAHGHILRVLAALWIGLPPQGGARLALSTGTLSTLGWERETQVIRSWNS